MPRWKKVWIREYHGKRGTTYRVSFYDPAKRARRTIRTFHSKHSAKAFANEYEAFLNGEAPKPESNTSIRKTRIQPNLWSTTTDQWLNSGAMRDRTRKNYGYVLDQFKQFSGITCVEEVTETEVSNFLSSVKRRGCSLATCGTYFRALSTFLRWARPSDYPITTNLVSRWKPYKKRKRARPHYFTFEEYQSMQGACEKVVVRSNDHRSPLWWNCYISVLYYAGLRMNEATHLIWRDIDFDKGILCIQPHVKLKGVFEWRPKGKARRSVPVPSEVISYLAQMQHSQSEGIPYVFLSYNRYVELQNNNPRGELIWNIGKGFRRIRDLADVSEGTIHDMRRTCITNWTKQPSLTPKDVQILAGHEDLNTTLDIYAMVDGFPLPCPALVSIRIMTGSGPD